MPVAAGRLPWRRSLQACSCWGQRGLARSLFRGEPVWKLLGLGADTPRRVEVHSWQRARCCSVAGTCTHRPAFSSGCCENVATGTRLGHMVPRSVSCPLVGCSVRPLGGLVVLRQWWTTGVAFPRGFGSLPPPRALLFDISASTCSATTYLRRMYPGPSTQSIEKLKRPQNVHSGLSELDKTDAI